MPNREQSIERDFDDLVVRYLSGRLVGPRLTAFETWLEQDPSHRALVERLKAIWDTSAELPEEVEADVDTVLAELKQRAFDRAMVASRRRPERELRLEPLSSGGRRVRAVMWRVAAAVAVLAGATLLWRVERGDTAATRQWAGHRYTTARGERLAVALSDGTVVTLHNESALEVPRDFGATTRDVRLLRGEGYFEVAHDPSHPFQVYADRLVTRVLGTKFSVRARPGDEGARVVVAEGRVAIGAERIGRDAPVLTAGQVARLSTTGSIAIQRGIDVARLLGWTHGRLIFDHTPVPEVLAELSRWFNRDFVLADSAVAGLRLTTALSGQSLDEAIAVLESSLEVRAVVDGRRIELKTRS